MRQQQMRPPVFRLNASTLTYNLRWFLQSRVVHFRFIYGSFLDDQRNEPVRFKLGSFLSMRNEPNLNLIWTALRHFKLGSFWMQFQCWPLSTTSKPASLSKISPMAQLLLGKAVGSEEALTGFIKMNLTNGMVATWTSEVHFFKVFWEMNLNWT